MMFEVAPSLSAESFFEVAGGKPNQRGRDGVKTVVDARRRHAERTHVIADHRLILETLDDFAGRPKTGGVRRPHEFIGDHAAVHVRPERKVALNAARARQRTDAAAKHQMTVEGVLKVAGENDL